MRRGDQRSSFERERENELSRNAVAAELRERTAKAKYYEGQVAQPMSPQDKLLAQQEKMAQIALTKATVSGLEDENMRKTSDWANAFKPGLGQQMTEYNSLMENTLGKGKADVEKIRADAALARGGAATAFSQGDLFRQQAETERFRSEQFRNNPNLVAKILGAPDVVAQDSSVVTTLESVQAAKPQDVIYSTPGPPVRRKINPDGSSYVPTDVADSMFPHKDSLVGRLLSAPSDLGNMVFGPPAEALYKGGTWAHKQLFKPRQW